MVFTNANMITIIHGDDNAASRTYYKSLQKKDASIFDGEKVTADDIHQATTSQSLFSEEKNIYLENFFSKRKTSKETEAILALLQNTDEHITLVFWESKQLTKKQLDTFPKSIQKVFMLSKSLFAFLDAVKPNNSKQVFSLYHETLKHTEAEMILAMLSRQIRILLTLSDINSSDQIDEVKRIAPWQKNKLLSQARAFSQAELLKLHEAIFKVDVTSKRGGLSLPLSQTIDFLLLSI
jgi:DNA polymerase III delta subunit